MSLSDSYNSFRLLHIINVDFKFLEDPVSQVSWKKQTKKNPLFWLICFELANDNSNFISDFSSISSFVCDFIATEMKQIIRTIKQRIKEKEEPIDKITELDIGS